MELQGCVGVGEGNSGEHVQHLPVRKDVEDVYAALMDLGCNSKLCQILLAEMQRQHAELKQPAPLRDFGVQDPLHRQLAGKLYSRAADILLASLLTADRSSKKQSDRRMHQHLRRIHSHAVKQIF
eukprot:CAMPEP_0117680554 /NCGR_PEP_ID=MMETSP0804-20121206/18424_1 /TAXON_ID=1074897 /ORGANISM="Tetraselmis astigmatica, Strain CCMP880" /LENGTH=124 /DNA_ID=CAMNT_0005490079 /DNA_START=628 /DNA_END=1002 /DNA_ORIENTATION=+